MSYRYLIKLRENDFLERFDEMPDKFFCYTVRDEVIKVVMLANSDGSQSCFKYIPGDVLGVPISTAEAKDLQEINSAPMIERYQTPLNDFNTIWLASYVMPENGVQIDFLQSLREYAGKEFEYTIDVSSSHLLS